MSFNPTQNAAVLAALQARVDAKFPNQGANFALVSFEPSPRFSGDSKFQASTPVNPKQTRTAIAWSAVYRGRNVPGTTIVCNAGTATEAMATAMLLTEASEVLDLIDRNIDSQAQNALYPDTRPGQ